MKQRCKVVAMPTKEKTLMAYDSDTKEYFVPVCNFKLANSCSYIHLYVVSDDEIKEGDYMMLKCEHPCGRIRKCYWIEEDRFYIDEKENEKGWGFCYQKEVYKIIATTDPSLNIPLIPEQFMKDYCDANGIEQVMCEIKVDYDAICEIKPEECRLYNNGRGDCEDCIKAIKKVSISPIKESWSREELPIQSIMQVLKYCEDNQVYDKLSKYDDFYYKLNGWVKRNV